jgi:glucosamine-6-phosphate deaminase
LGDEEMAKEFTFSPAKCIPFRDKEVLERVRNIKKEDITKHSNPDFQISVIPDHEFDFLMIMDMFYRIKTAADKGEKVVFILSQPEPIYKPVAMLCNKFRVDCKHVHTFNMDEWADEDGNVAPETYPQGFMHAMKKNFYATLDEKLRPPEKQIQGPSTKNLKDYGKMLADLGGADLCISGPGWTGHLAFIEPDAPEFAAESLEEWKQMGPRIVTLSPITIAQNSLHGSFGASGDMGNVPPKAATIGPAEVVGSKMRIDMNNLQTAGTFVSWQRLMTRLVAHGPVTPLVPTSILQTLRTDFWISETVAANIEPQDFGY